MALKTDSAVGAANPKKSWSAPEVRTHGIAVPMNLMACSNPNFPFECAPGSNICVADESEC